MLQADEVSYDSAAGIVAARGNVEVVAGERILKADVLSYNQNTDVVVAEGNVSILEPDGTVLFADRVELRDQLKNGTVTQFRALLADDSRFAAASAVRVDGNTTVMRRAVYSPCEVCEEDPDEPPLWRIRASTVKHDQANQTIEYTNARLEFFGVPVLYTPYFSHTDPTVERKSGFLVPTQSRSTQLGIAIEIPYFFNIAPNMDATLSPLFTSKEGTVLGGEFRHRTEAGRYQFNGSVTRADERDDRNVKTGDRETRSHLFGEGLFRWDETWRYGFATAIASDDTYLARYRISDVDSLTSNLFVEGFADRSYAAANAYYFQGLRPEDDPGETPLVLPMLDHNLITEPDRFGGTFRLDSNVLSLTRKEGSDSHRLSLRGGWVLPRIGRLGDVLTLRAEVFADGYVTSDQTPQQVSGDDDGFTGRLFPQASIDWRLPLVRREEASHQLIEPIVNLVVSPYGGNPSEIPNEDSLNFEFDDTNLISANRFPGIDRVEGGPRLNLALRYGIYGDGGGYITALAGQVLRLEEDDTFADKTGLEDERSDYVGRIDVSPFPFLRFYERVRLDRDTLALRRNEITLDAGPPRYRLSATYVSLSRELTTDELTDRKEINLAALAALSRYWFIRGATRRDLTEDGGTINSSIGVVYDDECFNLSVDFERDFTRDRDIEPSTTISFRIRLKNLGA